MFKVSPASLQIFIDRLILTPSVISNSNYVIMVFETVYNHQVHRDFLISLY
jgi:hypothetical protein